MKLLIAECAADALTLALAGRLSGLPMRPFRLAAGAGVGAAISAAARACGFAQTWALWLPVSLLMMTVAGGRRALRRPIRSAALLLCAAGLLGGTIDALALATRSLPAAWALGAVCLLLTAARASSLAQARRMGLWVRLSIRGRTAELEGILDSGNSLRDYLTRRSVVVLPEAAMKRFGLSEEAAGMRLIFADTAGGRQMMRLIVPEACELIRRGERRFVEAAVAFSPGLPAGAPALVPGRLMNEEENEMDITGGRSYGNGQE